ncbi:MAG: hypothetical protein HY815_13765 [Candidatus Riflebacteria bacterium]|nr:hypothetical protein [Candidatus Riflebacteria bacterium]
MMEQGDLLQMKIKTLVLAVLCFGLALAGPVHSEETRPTGATQGLAIAYRLGLFSVTCQDVPVSIFFLEFARQTAIPVRLDLGADYPITASFRGLTLERALGKLLPRDTYEVVREPGAPARVVRIVVKAAPRSGGETGDPVAVQTGSINLNPSPAAASTPARPAAIRVMTPEEQRAEPPAVEETEAAAPAMPTLARADGPSRGAPGPLRPPTRIQDLVKRYLKR